jgi:hypothetical protein
MKTTNKLSVGILAVMFAVFVGGGVVSLVTPTASYAAGFTCAGSKAQQIFGLPVWYTGLNVSDTNCDIVSPSDVGGISPFIWRIALNGIDIALRLVGYIAVGYIIYGGFAMITANGAPDSVAKARKTILNAVIGLVISIGSVAIVNLVLGIMK